MVNRLVPVVLAALLLAASVVPAGAERLVTPDDRADVWSPSGFNGFTAEGFVVNTDVRRTAVWHSAKAVTVKTTYFRLRKGRGDELDFSVYLKTSNRRQFGILASIDSDDGSGSASMYRGIGHDVDCPKLRVRTDFAADWVRVRIPLPCIRNPRWVKYEALTESYIEDEDLYRDNVLGPGPRLNQWSSRIRRS